MKQNLLKFQLVVGTESEGDGGDRGERSKCKDFGAKQFQACSESSVERNNVEAVLATTESQQLLKTQAERHKAKEENSLNAPHSASSVLGVVCAPSVHRQCKAPYIAVDFCFGFLPNWHLTLGRDATDIM